MKGKRLVIENRDGSIFQTILKFEFSQLKMNDVNTITILEDPNIFSGKIAKIYSGDKLIGSGTIETINFKQTTKQHSLKLYPLIYDLNSRYIEDGVGNKIVHYNDTIENILLDIITKYRAKISNPILNIGTLNSTGISISYTFESKTYIEAINTLIGYLDKTAYIRYNLDGTIDTGNSGTEKRLVYGKNISDIDYQEDRTKIKNYIIFENSLSDADKILSEYYDQDSIDEYGIRPYRRVDSRVTIQATADTWANNYLAKYKDPQIIVESIESTNLDINLYDKIRIDNWDKKFVDDLYCVGLTYTNKDTVMIEIDYKSISRSQIQTSQETLDISIKSTTGNIPGYIHQTYIDSTTVQSPVIAGNDGYFSQTMTVGSEGIIIDGINKLIKSNNFATGISGRQIDNNGNAEFNSATLRGDFVAGSININNNFTVDEDGNVRGNDFTNKSILFEPISEPSTTDGQMRCGPNLGVGKVLWAYMGDQTSKQQLSMSGMKFTGSFEHTSSSSFNITTRFKPRNVFFFGYFYNTTLKKYGITVGQASYGEDGTCSSIKLGFEEITYIDDVTLNFSSVVSSINFATSSYTTVNAATSYSKNTYSKDVLSLIDVAGIAKLGTDSIANNVYVTAGSWSDTGLTITTNIGSGRVIGGNYIVQG